MIFNFTPTQGVLFSFQPTIDNQMCMAYVPWNLAGQRFYITLYDANGSIVMNRPMIGSSTTDDIEDFDLLAGYADRTRMFYYPENNQIVVTE